MPGLTRRRLFVTGAVQGVWFRESCREQATAVGVSGWIRNLHDGRVEAVLEGPEAAVDRVVRWCEQGPSRARVERVDVLVEEPVGEAGFRVR